MTDKWPPEDPDLPPHGKAKLFPLFGGIFGGSVGPMTKRILFESFKSWLTLFAVTLLVINEVVKWILLP